MHCRLTWRDISVTKIIGYSAANLYYRNFQASKVASGSYTLTIDVAKRDEENANLAKNNKQKYLDDVQPLFHKPKQTDILLTASRTDKYR